MHPLSIHGETKQTSPSSILHQPCKGSTYGFLRRRQMLTCRSNRYQTIREAPKDSTTPEQTFLLLSWSTRTSLLNLRATGMRPSHSPFQMSWREPAYAACVPTLTHSHPRSGGSFNACLLVRMLWSCSCASWCSFVFGGVSLRTRCATSSSLTMACVWRVAASYVTKSGI